MKLEKNAYRHLSASNIFGRAILKLPSTIQIRHSRLLSYSVNYMITQVLIDHTPTLSYTGLQNGVAQPLSRVDSKLLLVVVTVK
jgi:hypothetical protein